MKLSELKRRFQNKYVIRMTAGALTVAMLAGSATVCDVYAAKRAKEDQTEVSTAESKEKKVKTEEGDEEKETALSKFLSSGDDSGKKEIQKEETVYIFADSYGAAQSTIVSEWLKNPEGKDVLTDASDLSGIENVKGDEAFEKKGTSLSWQADGKDIYYQGTTTKQAPVTVKVTYELNGKEVSAKEIAGKSGTVKIRFDYENHAKDGDVCVPFAVISGMFLKDNFTNVQVENGKVISNGDGSIVTGLAMPGLKESLKIEESDVSKDLSIPDYVEVTADVEDFALDMTLTAVTGLSELSSGSSFDLSELDEKIDDLKSASGQLEDGSKELEEGLSTFHQKMGEFASGAGALQNGVAAYTDGADQLANGISALKGQTGLLISGVSDLVSSIGTLNGGVQELDRALNAPMGEKEKAAAKAQASQAAGAAIDAQFADDSNPQGYRNIKSQAAQAFYASVANDATRQSAAAAARQSATAGIAAQKPAIEAQAKGQAAAGIEAQKPAIAAQAKQAALAGISGQMDDIANQAKDEAAAAAAGAIPAETKEQLRAAFMAAGFTQAAQANGITVEAAMGDAGIQTAVSRAADAQLSNLIGTVGTAAGQVADQTARSVASNVAGSIAEQVAGSVAGQVADSVAGQVAGSVAEQVAGSVAEQVAPGVVDSVAGQAKDAVGTSVADSVKQGAKTAAAAAAGEAAVAGAESAKKQIASQIEKKDAKSGHSLVSGMQALGQAVGGMSEKMPQLTAGIDQLYAGGSMLSSKSGELASGASKLTDGAGQLMDGASLLKDGSVKLSDGMAEFDEEGIKKLADAYEGDAKEFADRIRAVLKAGESYESFGGKKKETAGNVKFIIRTAEISNEDE